MFHANIESASIIFFILLNHSCAFFRYNGPKKVLGVFLSAAYMVCKGPDIVAKLKGFQAAIIKFINCIVSKDKEIRHELEYQ